MARFPGDFDVTFYGSTSGVRLSQPTLVRGSAGELGDKLNELIIMRNAVAHRDFGMPRADSDDLPFVTDAEMAATINTSTARVVVAPMLQLVTQAIDALRMMTSTPEDPVRLDAGRYPAWWFTGESPDGPTRLWGGRRDPPLSSRLLPTGRPPTPRDACVGETVGYLLTRLCRRQLSRIIAVDREPS